MKRGSIECDKAATVWRMENKMESYTNTKNEKNFKKISAFLNVSQDVLNRQDPNLLMKMIDAADDDQMIAVHHYGMEMKGRF
jgi:hypothetical protein